MWRPHVDLRLPAIALVLGVLVASPSAGRLPLAATGQVLPSSTRDLVALAADYTRRYQDEFQFLIADEIAEQQVQSGSDVPGSFVDRRVTKGELFVTYLASERQWTVVHDVGEVDGIPVRDREDVAGWLRDDRMSAAARRIFALNARYNIGRVTRNFNDPMLALLPLGDTQRSRFSFSSAISNTGNTTQTTLTFRERERPTIIRDTRGRPVYTRGELLVDARTGVIQKTRLMLSHDGVDADLTTTFELDARIGLWLPSVFSERYGSNRDGRREVTTCESRYSNYRRFEVVGRLR